jgi:hypothetical protein
LVLRERIEETGNIPTQLMYISLIVDETFLYGGHNGKNWKDMRQNLLLQQQQKQVEKEDVGWNVTSSTTETVKLGIEQKLHSLLLRE